MTGAEGESLTHPGDPDWREEERGFRRWQKTTVLGAGDDVWRWAATEVLRWGVKTRSGFSVTPATVVTQGSRPIILAHPFGLSVREPVEVVEVIDTSDRVGFAYRTLAGHPVSGEEAFVVHRDGDLVLLTIRSLTRPASGLPWRALYPALLVAQSVARHRNVRAHRRRASP